MEQADSSFAPLCCVGLCSVRYHQTVSLLTSLIVVFKAFLLLVTSRLCLFCFCLVLTRPDFQTRRSSRRSCIALTAHSSNSLIQLVLFPHKAGFTATTRKAGSCHVRLVCLRQDAGQEVKKTLNENEHLLPKENKCEKK